MALKGWKGMFQGYVALVGGTRQAVKPTHNPIKYAGTLCMTQGEPCQVLAGILSMLPATLLMLLLLFFLLAGGVGVCRLHELPRHSGHGHEQA